jgi:Zn-dependent protease
MDPISIVIFVFILLVSVIFHEVAHGLAADKLGDPTARYAGRLTLNPIPHIDPLWSLLLPAMLIYFGSPVLFGAAKPVPVNFANLRNTKRDMIIVAIVGPLTNIVLAIIAALIYKFVPGISSMGRELLVETASLNVVLAVFNMIPVPPLDGSKVLGGLLGFVDRNVMYNFLELERFGFIFLIVLLFTGLFEKIIFGPYLFLVETLFGRLPPELFTRMFGL